MKFWDVFRLSDFGFEDWTHKDKFAVVLTSPDDSYYYFLHLLATSKVQKYTWRISEDEYVIIEEWTLDFFSLQTLLVVHNIFNTSEDDFLRYSADYQWKLPLEICEQIKEKILKSKFVRKFQKDIIKRNLERTQ